MYFHTRLIIRHFHYIKCQHPFLNVNVFGLHMSTRCCQTCVSWVSCLMHPHTFTEGPVFQSQYSHFLSFRNSNNSAVAVEELWQFQKKFLQRTSVGLLTRICLSVLGKHYGFVGYSLCNGYIHSSMLAKKTLT